jgi:general secretion pathway protein G
MKTQSPSFRRGFTLVEMLAVITIIVILASVVMVGMRFAKDKEARNKAKIQVEMLSAACEEYKLDNGTAPQGGNGQKGDSKILYRALYWDSNDNGSGPDSDNQQKIYISELDPENNKQGWTDGKKSEVRLIDPWGNEYHYRSGKTADGKANPNAMNPDADIWSAGPDGKTSASGDTKDTKDDIRNW